MPGLVRAIRPSRLAHKGSQVHVTMAKASTTKGVRGATEQSTVKTFKQESTGASRKSPPIRKEKDVSPTAQR